MKKTIRIAITLTILFSMLGGTPPQPARAATELTVTNTSSNGTGSLRQAIADASNGDTISFAPYLAGETIHLVSELEVDKSITIDGSALSSRITLSGDTDADEVGDVQIMAIGFDGAVKIVNVDFVNGKNEDYILAGGINNFGGSLELENCTFSGNTGDTGGAMFNKGNLTVQNCIFNNNSANDGGAILNDIDAVATIADSQFAHNTATGEYASAGAIGNLGDLTITNSEFIENSATFGGGAVVNGLGITGGTVISDSTFTSNSTDGKGGAIYIAEGDFTISDSTFNLNMAVLGGGAIFNGGAIFGSEGNITISGSIFTNNTVNWNGGAILNQDGSINISNSEFVDNIANNDGGAIFNNGDISISDSEFTGNAASSLGGGIANHGTLAVTNSTLSLNTAEWGGGIVNLGTLAITNSSILENSADPESGGGGGILNTYDENSSGVLTITNSTISANVSFSGGGILIHSPAGEAIISNNTISGNTVSLNGGGIANFGGTLTMANNTLFGNSAENGGGIINFDTLTMTNNTLSDNSALINGGGLYNGGALHMYNTIIANSPNGEDCFNHETSGAIDTNINNLMENNAASPNQCGTPSSTSDPNLGPLADNGGPTQTMALLPGSPAIDAGDDDTCEDTDQRGVARPQGSQCDIGAFEYEPDIIPPTVTSITRADPNPTAAASVDFTVTFSEPVINVDTADFELGVTGITGAYITGMTGSDDVYTVSVHTGSRGGTIRLDVPVSATITDLTGNPLANLPYQSGESYNIKKSLTFKSAASQDGWILESTETSNTGGTKNNTASTINLGDDSANRQYRAILSFNTSALPTNAVITKVTFKAKRQGVNGGGNPVNIFNGFMVEIKKGAFGTSALQLGDFKTAPNKTIGPFSPALSSGWYKINLTKGKDLINKSGLTQIRLRFKLDDNNNLAANILKLYSGNAGAVNRPQLIVEYFVP